MSYMFVPNFEAIGHVILVLGPENHPASLAYKAISVKNGQVRQKIFHMVVCLKIPFQPNQPTFARDEVFFFLIFVRSSPKPQNIEI